MATPDAEAREDRPKADQSGERIPPTPDSSVSRRTTVLTGCLSFAIFVAAMLFWIGISDETLSGSPGRQGDDVYFENIAWNLDRELAVAFDFPNPQWQQPYRDDNADGRNDWIFEIPVRGKTTSRSPGFPFFVAAIYKTLDRNWFAVRLAQILILAGALALLTISVGRTGGNWAAAIVTATLAADFFVLRTSGQFMSEALGTAIVALLFVCCLTASPDSKNSSPFRWLAIGILFGVGCLVRANMNAWLLLILASSAAWTVWRALAGKPLKPVLIRVLLFVSGVIIVTTPWWIRNCQVTGGLAPFGTSGSFGLAGGYCDPAYENFGNWHLATVLASQKASMNSSGFDEKSLPQQEFQMGQDSTRSAWNWVVEHPLKIPGLMLMKGYSHLGFYRQPGWLMLINALLCFGALVGCLSGRRDFGYWVAVLVLLSLVTTMLTWSHFGRYSIPIRPLIHAASAVGTVVFWRWLLREARLGSGRLQ